MRRRSRGDLCLIGVGTVASLGYALNFELAPLVDRLGLSVRAGDPLGAYPVLYFSLFALYGLACGVVLRKGPERASLGLIVGFAIIFRVALLFAPLVLSSDVYRYIWDGRVQRAGINPYLHAPASPELAPLRDEVIYPRINRPEAPTIYPPGAQFLFAGIALVFPDSVTAMKAIMLLFDLGTILLIVRLLRGAGMDTDRVLLYAWSPLAVFELAGSAHLEALMLPFVLLALVAGAEGRPGLAGAALGTATLVKLYPAVLFPALYQRRDRVFPLVFTATVLAGYLLYLAGAGEKVLGFLPAYFGRFEDFNVGVRDLVAAALAPFTASARAVAMFLVTALLAAVGLVLAARRDDRPDVLRRGYLMVGATLLLLPTSLHPWYVIWILPFLCLYPAVGWLYFSGAVALSYVKYLREPQVLPLGIRLLEFLPLVLLLGAQAAWRRRAPTETPPAMTPMMEKP